MENCLRHAVHTAKNADARPERVSPSMKQDPPHAALWAVNIVLPVAVVPSVAVALPVAVVLLVAAVLPVAVLLPVTVVMKCVELNVRLPTEQ